MKLKPLLLVLSLFLTGCISYSPNQALNTKFDKKQELENEILKRFQGPSIDYLDVLIFAYLDQGGDPNLSLPNKSSLLHFASQGQNLSLTKALLKAGANPNVLEFETPLARQGNIFIVQLLVEAGASPNLAGISRITPFQHAVSDNQFHIVQYFLKHGAEFKSDNSLVFRANKIGMLKLLIDAGAPLDVRNDTGQSLLEVTQDLDLLKYIIQKGLPVDFTNSLGKSALFKANRLEKFKLLLDLGANAHLKDTQGSTPIYDFARSGNEVLFEHLAAHLQQKGLTRTQIITETYTNQSTLLHAAILGNNIKIVNWCLEAGANPNLIIQDKQTALTLAIDNYLPDIVKALLEHQADINQARLTEQSALYRAVKSEKLDLIKILVESMKLTDLQAQIQYALQNNRLSEDHPIYLYLSQQK